MSLKIKKIKELILEDFELSIDIALIIFFVFTLIYLGIRGNSIGITEWVIICAVFAILLLTSLYIQYMVCIKI
jgi:hypothetical protein